MIEDHIKSKPLVDDSPDLNDREESPLEVEFQVPEIAEEEIVGEVDNNDEEDNILRGKNSSQISIDMKEEEK